MNDQAQPQSPFAPDLSDDDRIRISEIFQEDIVPKLLMMHARNGNINCEFAGKKYKSWVIQFKSSRSGLEIVAFEYDPNSGSFPLPRPQVRRDMTHDV